MSRQQRRPAQNVGGGANHGRSAGRAALPAAAAGLPVREHETDKARLSRPRGPPTPEAGGLGIEACAHADAVHEGRVVWARHGVDKNPGWLGQSPASVRQPQTRTPGSRSPGIATHPHSFPRLAPDGSTVPANRRLVGVDTSSAHAKPDWDSVDAPAAPGNGCY